MQNNKDHRDKKELEVEEFLSEFEADDIPDSDISSFLMEEVPKDYRDSEDEDLANPVQETSHSDISDLHTDHTMNTDHTDDTEISEAAKQRDDTASPNSDAGGSAKTHRFRDLFHRDRKNTDGTEGTQDNSLNEEILENTDVSTPVPPADSVVPEAESDSMDDADDAFDREIDIEQPLTLSTDEAEDADLRSIFPDMESVEEIKEDPADILPLEDIRLEDASPAPLNLEKISSEDTTGTDPASSDAAAGAAYVAAAIAKENGTDTDTAADMDSESAQSDKDTPSSADPGDGPDTAADHSDRAADETDVPERNSQSAPDTSSDSSVSSANPDSERAESIPDSASDHSDGTVPPQSESDSSQNTSGDAGTKETAPDNKSYGLEPADTVAAAETAEPEKPDAKSQSSSAQKPVKKHRVRRFFSLFVDNPNYDPDQGQYIMKGNKQKKNKKKKFSFGHLIRDFVMLILVGAVAFATYAFVTINEADKIDPKNIYDNIAQSSEIYDDEGVLISNVYYTQDRQICKYEDMPDDLINAFVAIEDKTFWTHHGINWTRMAGAVVQALTGDSDRISGTSTITQQLARNVYLTDTMSERTIKRKIIEIYYAMVIERELSKEEIIEAYLNTIYLGYGCYGVETASEAYFSKKPADLTLIECAALAALPQAPDSYALVQMISDGDTVDDNDVIIKKKPNKYVANDESKSRRQTCLDLMLEQGYITQEQYDEVYDEDLIDFINAEFPKTSSPYTYFNEYLIDQVIDDLMEKYDYSESEATDMVYTGGLKIHSTMDSKAQKVIVKEFKDNSNFPTLMGYNTDGNGNIINDSGGIMLYDYDNFFDDDGNFKLKKDECTINDDGSLTIKSGYRLNIYTTSVGDDIDYSLEFKSTYVTENNHLYMYNGGYVNIPSQYKSLDENDNLVISADYFEDYPDAIKLGDETATLTEASYTLPSKTIEPQAAMVIVEVGTGEVKAMVGGRKQSGQQLYNRALNPRQSGSSIKPISVYSGALQKSYEYAEQGEKFPLVDTGHDSQGTKYYGDYLTASSVIVDEKMTFNGRVWPQNSGNTYSGAVTMRKALQNSINVCAVKLELQLGDEYTADLVEKFGITTLDREGDTNDLNPAALALGGLTNGVIPLEMAQAYATFPNGGVRQSSIAYTTVEDRNGEVILESESEATKVLDEGVAFIMTDMLKSVVTNGIGSPAAISGVQVGGKTGTTSSEYDIWFDGFTPSYAAALWIGTDVNIQLSSMSSMAASLWGNIMGQIPNAKKGKYKSQPDDVVYTGGEYYTKGTESGRSTYFADLAEARRKKAAAEAKKKAEEEAKKKAEEEAKKQAEESEESGDDDD